ncbi:Gfo/Idh/MocA family oxidoreductase [Paenibacillus sp. J5C_2022]|uniref:Gfo/Idh/MocA family protein n=1 Tax=Paenibacillus sp. J5C2022 TaxID=2977129 RepID=UPI0021CF8D09|nr:Gfo/Idh/MocA family oxidoreductase [Paenibacillus sp. J5C2022]MCU6712627.1 Gfo/Idh/MocA family oxidoreductase [Paenibacillus sp. J5C2022]
MQQLRIALIGLGRFAQLHAHIWRQLPHVQITALCDRDEDRFAPFREWFPDATCYTDWQEMLASQPFDAVDILTPEHMHAEPAIAAMEVGAHVFVEKPIAHHADAAEAMIRTARQRGRMLMIGHVLRFDPRYIAMKQELQRGAYGSIRSIYAKRNNGTIYFPIYNRVNPVYILGIHDIDLMHWYMEDEVREVYTVRSSRDDGGPADMSWAMLTFRRGGIGILENNWLVPQGAPSETDIRMEITTGQGTLLMKDTTQGVSFSDASGTQSPALLNQYDVHGVIGGPLAYELRHFADCVLAGRPSTVLQPSDALRALRVAAAVEQSAKEGKPVSLSPISEERTAR